MLHMARVWAGVAGWTGPIANRPASVFPPSMKPLTFRPATPTSVLGRAHRIVMGATVCRRGSISPLRAGTVPFGRWSWRCPQRQRHREKAHVVQRFNFVNPLWPEL